VRRVSEEGVVIEDEEAIREAFRRRFSNLFSSDFQVQPIDPTLSLPMVGEDEARDIIRPLDMKELEEVVKYSNVDKAPGPDGFNAKFFKAMWECVKGDLFKAVESFMKSGKLLKQVNYTSITLIPKKTTPTVIDDYRPISLCNMVYRFISKILANRLKVLLPKLVGETQNAFVSGRRISDICHNMHLGGGRGRMCLKLDLRKAYDSISWSFLEEVLKRVGLPDHWCKLMMACVRASFVVTVNGENSRPFAATNGLRQGDPLAPYLFVLCMEVLSAMFRREVERGSLEPARCGDVQISHLLFADDVMVFAAATRANAQVIKRILTEFSTNSGLQLNVAKSQVFMGGGATEGTWICSHLGMERADFPVTYLGLPLFSARLGRHHCMGLVSKVQQRLSTWKRNFLSMAGRVELVKSVLVSMSIYWTSAFLLPRKVLKEVESIMIHFIWGGPTKWVAVAWKDICKPKKEGGLGLRRLKDWNDAGMVRLLWLIIEDGGSLWVRCIRRKYLRNRNIWLARPPAGCSWAWRGILSVREVAKNRIQYQVGDGTAIRFFTDPWCGQPLLSSPGGERLHYDMGMPRDTLVSWFIHEGVWTLPEPRSLEMVVLWPRILQTQIHGGRDKPIRAGARSETFSAREAWSWVVPRGRKVGWTEVVWHKYHIPKHAITLWRAMRGRLITKLLMRARGATHDPRCVLCEERDEDMAHLFWECRFTRQVWVQMLRILRLDTTAGLTLGAEVERLQKMRGSKLQQATTRLALAATIYECWQERNRRIFEKEKCRPEDVSTFIKDAVRLMGTRIRELRDDAEALRMYESNWG